WLRYRYNLARLNFGLGKQRKALSNELEAARKSAKPPEEIREISQRLASLEHRHRHGQLTLQSYYLSDLAAKRLIEVPEMSIDTLIGEQDQSDNWMLSVFTGTFLLKEKPMRELLLALRADRRERLEIARTWAGTIITGLTGLIGVLIGLLAF